MLGKDILRVHATIWAATLLNLGLELPKSFFIHGHILSGGKKMSKTLGNVISIGDMLDKFGVDGTRYLLMSGGTFGDDLDLTMERMTEKYNNDLANGLGNLVSRVVKLSEKTSKDFKKISSYSEILTDDYYNWIEKEQWMSNARIDFILEFCFTEVRILNKKIEDNKPWELFKNDTARFEVVMGELIRSLSVVAIVLDAFLPETAQKIKTALETKKAEPLFQRIKM
ncbi:MAG: Methionine-tRNA ligase [Candidatus Moranbacteria bacterium GW2011_GWC2_45_10]|nr:MAG: Methionine-tRNA ligase [Candidatus Moranbacteria bacterium GW2011_GWC2_45_10]